MDLRVAREAARVAEKKLRDVGEVIESQVKGEVRRVQAELTTKEGLELAMVREIRLLKTQVEHYMQASNSTCNPSFNLTRPRTGCIPAPSKLLGTAQAFLVVTYTQYGIPAVH